MLNLIFANMKSYIHIHNNLILDWQLHLFGIDLCLNEWWKVAHPQSYLCVRPRSGSVHQIGTAHWHQCSCPNRTNYNRTTVIKKHLTRYKYTIRLRCVFWWTQSPFVFIFVQNFWEKILDKYENTVIFTPQPKNFIHQ